MKNDSLHLTPLGAGDLIDRAIRFYRGNFWTFVWIAAPPILVGTIITVLWTILGRWLFASGGYRSPDAVFVSGLFRFLGNSVIWFVESVATLSVMGGAARNFVRHLLFGEPVTFRETYRNVGKRLGGLLLASTLVCFLLSIFGLIIFYFGIFVLTIAIFVIIAAFSSIPFLAAIVSIVVGLAILFGTGWLFFLVASRFAYVPQIMLVEGLGVAAAIGRSANLASGNVKRLYALFAFSSVATYISLLLFYIPLGWYAYLNGVEIFSLNPDASPVWYLIAVQVVSQASLILLTPVWMIGLCLMYVDERVRHEGYDIELMAARELGEIPHLPREFMNPLQPALATNKTAIDIPPPSKSQLTTLGLN
ncbi:MAG: hypothetical protein ACR2GD_08130 [Pyrinomonadaceae bacterium]